LAQVDRMLQTCCLTRLRLKMSPNLTVQSVFIESGRLLRCDICVQLHLILSESTHSKKATLLFSLMKLKVLLTLRKPHKLSILQTHLCILEYLMFTLLETCKHMVKKLSKAHKDSSLKSSVCLSLQRHRASYFLISKLWTHTRSVSTSPTRLSMSHQLKLQYKRVKKKSKGRCKLIE